MATVLANMAAHSPCQADIRRHGGVELLVRFLHERPLSLASKAELAACERVQQKAAIALSRLCHSGTNTEKIIHTKGESWVVIEKGHTQKASQVAIESGTCKSELQSVKEKGKQKR